MQIAALHAIHEGGAGLVCLGQSLTVERYLRPESIHQDLIADGYESFSLARFSTYRQRTIAELIGISAISATLKAAAPGQTPHDWQRTSDLAGDVQEILDRIGIQSKATITRCQNDIQVIVAHCHLPLAAVPRWKALQREFANRLRPFGAIDETRITQMLPAGEVLAVGVRANFDRLCDALLPISHEEFRKRPKKRNDGRAAELWWRRLREILEWCQCSWPAGVPPELRHRLLRMMTNALGWSVAEPSEIPAALAGLARKIAPGVPQWSIDAMTLAIRERIANDGDSALFRYTDEALAEYLTFGVGKVAKGKYKQIVKRGLSERQSRRAKVLGRKRATNVVNDERVHRATALAKSGMSIRKIASLLAVPKSTVGDWISSTVRRAVNGVSSLSR